MNRENYHKKTFTDFIKMISNTRYHLTITFNVDTKEKYVQLNVNRLLRLINNKYFNKRDEKKFLKGIAIREYKGDDSVHYHMLIYDNPVFRLKRNRKKIFGDIVNDCADKLVYKHTTSNGKKLTVNLFGKKYGIKVQDYYDGNLERYLSKSLETSKSFEFFTFIEFNGISFTELSDKTSFQYRSAKDRSKDGPCIIYNFQKKTA